MLNKYLYQKLHIRLKMNEFIACLSFTFDNSKAPKISIF